MLRIVDNAEELVSQPMIIPSTDDEYAVTMETSTDMVNWAPAAPGDYFGASSHSLSPRKGSAQAVCASELIQIKQDLTPSIESNLLAVSKPLYTGKSLA